MNAHKLPLFPLLLAMPASPLMAATNGISFDLSASAEYTDNARKKETDKLGEWQNEYGFGVNARYANEWVALSSSYDVDSRTFSEDSQPTYNMLTGETEVTLGGATDPATLFLSHSRRSLLNAPDALDLSVNRDQRDILTASPAFKWRISQADSLILSGNVSEVSYRVNEDKDSSRSGGQLVWSRNISKVDQFQLSVQQNEISFDSAPNGDYKYQSVSASYSAQLSHLGYSVQVGRNRALRDVASEDYSSPYYNVVSTYSTGVNLFKFAANQMITDSSSGNGNRVGLGGGGQSSAGVGIDLIKMRVIEFSWSYSGMCDRCIIGLNAEKNNEDYRALPEDSDETSIGAQFSYKLTRAASVHVDVSRHKRDFSDFSPRSDYTANRGRVSFDYRFINELKLNIYTQLEKRDSGGSTQNYDEHVTGLGFSYSF